jgi:hypothetical protein
MMATILKWQWGAVLPATTTVTNGSEANIMNENKPTQRGPTESQELKKDLHK